ncbi:TetR/AcrR family transcriptional regulator [Pseudonocardiaceae bacterium YIM PH 21723]|nr:TetR/AcrR family transcriptional regulator [Pseudonocardiaceae bacterium YIM PH 21723]
MTDVTRRDRARADTERDIRHTAHKLLVEQGREAVTLRAIARVLGITAPALYRYYASRDALLQELCRDVCADLTATAQLAMDNVPAADGPGRVSAICRSFRSWSLAHPQEFSLVFGSPKEPSALRTEWHPADDPFARVFLGLMARFFAETGGIVDTEGQSIDWVPPDLVDDLREYEYVLREVLEEMGAEIRGFPLNLAVIHLSLQWWVRLYGHVALEVFGAFPFALSDSEALFETLLEDLAKSTGVSG